MSTQRPGFLLAGIAMTVLACGDTRSATEPGPTAPPPPPPCELSLQVGQAAIPASGTAGCRLRAAAGAEYGLAVLDTRSIASAAGGAERSFGSYTVTVTLAGAAPPLSTASIHSAAAPAPADVPHMHWQEAPAVSLNGHAPHERSTPWVLGEQFTVQHPLRNASVAARVVRVYPDGLVAAWLEGEAAATVDEFLGQLDYAAGILREHSIPLLRTALAERLPVTSSGAGQYLMLLGVDSTARGRAWAVGRADTVFSWMTLNIATEPGEASLASLITHEMTHSFQFAYMRATRPPGVTSSSAGTSLWGVEGGANLISYEVIRRIAGMPLAGNVDWRNAPATPIGQFYALRAQPASGEFTNGYDNAMGFLRRLVIERVRAGEAVDEAVRQVSRGAVEGWYGHDQFGAQRAGLTARMRERFGTTWDPTRAMLDWTLSHAADDLTPNTTFQDHASLRVWDIPEAHPIGWRPAGTLSSKGAQTLSFQRVGGSPHYLYLRDEGDGVGFTITSSEPTLQWKLIRTR